MSLRAIKIHHMNIKSEAIPMRIVDSIDDAGNRVKLIR
jgi:hypothetical protein